jgi:drug/metabolite transporter (DMT)-like permease
MSINAILRGYLIGLLGILLLSPDAALIRLADLDSFTFSIWRGLFSGLLIVAIVAAQIGFAGLWQSIVNTQGIGYWLIILNFVGSISFVIAINNTSASNVLVLLACAPVFSAIIGRVFLREKLPWFTWLTIIICLACISIILGQDILQQNLLGSGAALVVALNLAIAAVLLRFTKQYNMAGCLGVAYLLIPLVLLGYFLFITGTISPQLALTPAQWGYVIADAIFVGAAFYFLANAPRYISAPELGLIMLLESLFGSLLVWMLVHEAPSVATLLSGTVVLVTLFMHGYWRIKQF